MVTEAEFNFENRFIFDHLALNTVGVGMHVRGTLQLEGMYSGECKDRQSSDVQHLLTAAPSNWTDLY